MKQLNFLDLIDMLDKLGMQHISELPTEPTPTVGQTGPQTPATTEDDDDDDTDTLTPQELTVIGIDALIADYIFDKNSLLDVSLETTQIITQLLRVRDYYINQE